MTILAFLKRRSRMAKEQEETPPFAILDHPSERLGHSKLAPITQLLLGLVRNSSIDSIDRSISCHCGNFLGGVGSIACHRTRASVLLGAPFPFSARIGYHDPMVKALEQAIAEIATLPDAEQDVIGRRLLSHLQKLRRLREEIDKGIRSLDAGEGKPLDIAELLD